METESHLVVYRYRYWSPDTNEMVESKRMATLDAIKKGLGVPVIESGTQVPVKSVDSSGWYVEAMPVESTPVESASAKPQVTE
jgi:hypothetical protein